MFLIPKTCFISCIYHVLSFLFIYSQPHFVSIRCILVKYVLGWGAVVLCVCERERERQRERERERERERKVPSKRPWRPTGRLEEKLYSFTDLGTRWEWMAHVMPRPVYPRERDTEPTTKEAGWAPALLELCINSKFGLLEKINVTSGDLWNENHAVIELTFHRICMFFLTADASIKGLQTLSAGQLHSLV